MVRIRHANHVRAVASRLRMVAVLVLLGGGIAGTSATAWARPPANVGAEMPRAAPPKPRCNRVASPAGDDRGSGTLRAPYRSFERLVGSLRPGMVGCLRG